jgi:putative oxidoreductase
MNCVLQLATGGAAPRAALFVRLGVGAVFFFEGIKKFLFVAQWSAGRFERIGIPLPHLTAPFDGAFEVVCGALILIGLLTRLAAIPLLIDILVALASTKIALLLKSGFWAMEAEARTDFAMLCGLLFLVMAGAGSLSVDAGVRRRQDVRTSRTW